MKYTTFVYLSVCITILLACFTTYYVNANNNQNIQLDLVGPQGSGTVNIVGKPDGVDQLHINTDGLLPNTTYTVFITNSPTLGALPAQFIGEFQTNPQGKGSFQAQTEVVNAFASANVNLQNEFGIADVIAAGALANGANTIPLDWIRIYVGNGNLSVFGTADDVVGGGLALTSASPIE